MKTMYLIAPAIILLTTSAALAAPGNTTASTIENSPFTGAYLGIYGGYDWSELDSAGSSPDLNGWDAGVMGGIRIDALLDRMKGFGIGLNGALEGFYGDSESDESAGGIELDKGNEWGVSFRPGLSFMDEVASPLGVSPYGILGYRNTQYKNSLGGSERYDGFELGIGAQLLAYGSWGVRTEYSHTWYSSENGIDPASDDIRVGLSYQF